jgi:glycosyltransferase involved in cell wall biosynthesis
VKDQLSIIIKTFERPMMLRRLLTSLKRRYPQLPVLIADDSKKPYTDSIVGSLGMRSTVRTFRMLYDSGLSAGRNLLVRNVQTPWYVLADDDFVIHDYTNLEHGLHMAQTHGLDIAAGQHIRIDKPCGWTARFHRIGTVGVCLPIEQLTNPFTPADIFPIFAVCRTETMRSIPGGPFDSDLKIGEHIAYCLRVMDRGLKAAVIRDFFVQDGSDRPPDYAPSRNREVLFVEQWMRTRGLSHLITPNGTIRASGEHWPKMDEDLIGWTRVGGAAASRLMLTPKDQETSNERDRLQPSESQPAMG